MFFDTHAHLNDAQFDADRDDVLRRASRAGVTRIIEIADAPADWERAVALSRVRPESVRCSLGLHPYYAAEWNEAIAETLPKKAKLPEVVAVGEIGLDYVKAPAPPEVQKESLSKMLALAFACGKPVVLHCRGAYPDMLRLLEGFYSDKPKTGRFRGVMHCFSGNAAEAETTVRLGFALGVDGPVTYPKNDPLREALKTAGLDNLVIETDSPYLPPQSSRGKRNDPSLLPEIAARIAEMFDTDVEAVARRTMHNGTELFKITPDNPGLST